MFIGRMAAAGLIVLIVGVACAGGGGSGGGVVSPSPGPGGALTACQALDEFERYRYTFNYRLFTPQPDTPLDETQVGTPPYAVPPNSPTFDFSQVHEGSLVNPDRFDIVVKNEGQPDLGLIYIGEQLWTYLAGSWIPSIGTEAASVSFPPGLVCNAMLSAPDFAAVVPVEEELKGEATRHYRFDRIEAATAAVIFGNEGDFGRLNVVYELDVWLTEDGWPARLETRSEGNYPSGRKLFIEVSLEVRDVNGNDIEVEPPI